MNYPHKQRLFHIYSKHDANFAVYLTLKGKHNMSKLTQLQEALQAHTTDAMIITNAQNRRYLTGFTGSAGTVIITKTRALLLVDFRYTQQATSQCTTFEVLEIDA